MQVDWTYRPLPVHVPFHIASADERAMAGAMGSGKSYALCAEAITWCLEQPGIRGVICRKHIPSLRDTTEAVFFDILPHELYMAGETRRSNNHVSEFIFPNGSTVLFKSMDDYLKHKSLNLGFFAADEANELTLEEWLFFTAGRMRQVDPTAAAVARGYTAPITRQGCWLAFNPEGHDWIYERFVNKGGKDYFEGSEWFRSTSFDNPYLPPAYINRLMNMPPEWIKRYVLCQFDDFGGQIYKDWAWDTHVIEPILEYPRGTVFWMGMDPGTENPTAGLWVYVDRPNRRLVGVAEYQEESLAAPKHALEWRKIEARLGRASHGGRVSWRVADGNSITTRDRGTNMKLSDQYRRLGYHFTLGSNNPKITIPALGNLIYTRRFVLTRECPQTYEAIKNYQWQDLTSQQRSAGIDPREKPLKRNTHLVECGQYLASRWLSPMKPEAPEPEDSLTAEIHRAIRKQQMRRAIFLPRQRDIGDVLV